MFPYTLNLTANSKNTKKLLEPRKKTLQIGIYIKIFLKPLIPRDKMLQEKNRTKFQWQKKDSFS
jgi:hypothetical protein